MDHALHLLVLLAAARLSGHIAVRFGQPASIGAIAAGVALALVAGLPAGRLLADIPDSPFLRIAAEFGIFFVVLQAGIEMRPAEIAKAPATSLAVAAGGVVLPLASGYGLAWIYLPDGPLRPAQALLVGVALSISAVPVAVKVLGELRLLHHRVGRTIVSAALFDDVIGLILLAILLALVETGTPPDAWAIAALLGQVALFFAIAAVAGRLAGPLLYRPAARLGLPAASFTALIVLALGLAALAEGLSLDVILGPFMAGLFFEPAAVGADRHAEVEEATAAVSDGLLAPLFFLSIGIRLDTTAVTAAPGLLVALLAVAFLGKIVGAALPARLVGLPPREATAVGIGLSGRGAVELVIASIALDAGLLDAPGWPVPQLFSILVVVAVVTTVAMPILLRACLRGAGPPTGADRD